MGVKCESWGPSLGGRLTSVPWLPHPGSGHEKADPACVHPGNIECVCHMPGAVLVPSGLPDRGGGGRSHNKDTSELKKHREVLCREDRKAEGVRGNEVGEPLAGGRGEGGGAPKGGDTWAET